MPGKLRSLDKVITAISLLYDKDGNYRASFSPDGFYKTQLLDTLEWGTENDVHQMFATTEILKPGQKAVKYRRYRALTPNLTPLPEGVPNTPDKLAYEEVEISNLFTFGRWYEFTAEVDWDVVDPVIAKATQNLVDVARRTKELYARKMWLSSPNQYFAAGKSFEDLTMADSIQLEDLLYITSTMERMQVKPIGGKFNYICSKEFLKGLIRDPLVKEYLSLQGVNPSEFLRAVNGEPLDLIDVKFIPTMLDEFAYPDIEFPGVYFNATLSQEVMRLVYEDTVGPAGRKTGTIYYLDIPAGFQLGEKTTDTFKINKTTVTYLQDGSAIDNLVKWGHNSLKATLLTADNTTDTGKVAAGKAGVRKAEITADTTTGRSVHGELAIVKSTAATDLATINTAFANGKFKQLPVHRGILFGDEALVKIVHANRNDQAELIVHKPGSAGVYDPYNQRQSVAIKVKGFGVGINRTEAVWVTFGIPYLAAQAYLQPQYMEGWGNSIMLDQRDQGGVNAVGTDGVQTMKVPGINLAANPLSTYPEYVDGKWAGALKKGEIINYKQELYVVTADITMVAGTTAGANNVFTKIKTVKIATPVAKAVELK